MTPVLALATAALALELAPLAQTQTIRGSSGSSSFTVALPAPETLAGPVRLELDLGYSGVLSTSGSWVTVELDGTPVATRSLEQLDQSGTARWQLTLPTVPAGFHELSVRASLHNEQDPCLSRDPESAWLSVGAETRVRAVSIPQPASPLEIRGLPAAWRGRAVAIDLPEPPSVEGVAALQQARSLLRSWGSEVGDGGPRLQWERGEVADPEARAELRLEGEDLIIRAATYEGLAGALQSLARPRLLERCEGAVCSLGAPPPPNAETTEAPDALTLAGQGMPRGWVAQGRGRHTLRMLMRPAVDWRVTDAPVLELDLILPSAAQLDPQRSRLTVFLGDLPLDAWTLEQGDGAPARLIARLPEAAWADAEWPLRIEAQLEPAGEERCRASDEAGPWLRIEPGSGLRVSREELRYDGLSGFARAAVDGAQLEFEPTLQWSEWHATLAIVESLEPTLVMACAGPCIRPRSSAAPSGPVHPSDVDGARWADRSGALDLPLKERTGRPVLHASECAGGQCKALAVSLPDGTAEAGSPDWASLLGATAIWDGSRWSGGGEGRPADRIEVAHGPAESPVMESESAASLRRTDGLMLGLVLGVVGIGGVWVARGARREDEDYEPVDVEDIP